MLVFLLPNCQIINKFSGINNVFTSKFYNGNWLQDVVGGYLLLGSFEALNLKFLVSRSFYFFQEESLCIYICILIINDNLNMYINDHLRMYTSDYALI